MDPELVRQQAETAGRAYQTHCAREVLPEAIRAGQAHAPRGRGEGFAGGEAEPPIEYVDQTPRRPRRDAIETQAEDTLGHHWVTILALDRARPRHFGDNTGIRAVWVEMNADWRQSGRIFDLNQADGRAVRVVVMGVRSAVHAARLKTAIETALHGAETAAGAFPLRHRFRNGVEFAGETDWWVPLVGDALLECEFDAPEFEVFSRADHERMVAERVRRITGPKRPGRRGIGS